MKYWPLYVLTLLFLLMGLAGCSALTNFLPSEQTLTPSGGTFSSSDNHCTLTVPAGAVTVATALTISPTTAGNLPTGATPIAVYNISAVGVTTLQQSASLVFNYGAGSVIGVSPTATMQMYWMNDNNQWQLLNGGALNAANYSFSINISHMGTYALCAS